MGALAHAYSHTHTHTQRIISKNDSKRKIPVKRNFDVSDTARTRKMREAGVIEKRDAMCRCHCGRFVHLKRILRRILRILFETMAETITCHCCYYYDYHCIHLAIYTSCKRIQWCVFRRCGCGADDTKMKIFHVCCCWWCWSSESMW